jgi:hypothetical protein
MLLDIETIGFISIKQVNYRLNSKNHAIFRNCIPKITPILRIEFQKSRFDSFLFVFWFVFDVMYIEIKLLKIIAKSKINTIFANTNSALGRLPL